MSVHFDGNNVKIVVSPYFLERTCAKNTCETNDNMQEIVILHQNIQRMQTRLNDILKVANQCIFEEIGRMPQSETKNAIKFKRLLSDRRFNKLKFDDIPNMSFKCKKVVEECQELNKSILEAKEKQNQIFEENKHKSIDTLRKELEKNKAFSNALSLSIKEELEKNILNFKNNKNITLNKKMKDTIYSLRNYYNRMVNKPSPFSTFTSTSIYLNTNGVGTSDLQNSGYTPKVYINELVPKTLENLFLEDNRFIENFFVKVNPLLSIFPEYYEFLNVDIHNQKMYYPENALKIKRSPKIDAIINGLKNRGNVKLLEFSQSLWESNSTMFKSLDEIIVLILKLDKIGLLYKNFNISHQDYSIMNKLYNLSKSCDDEQYKKISRSLGLIIYNINNLNLNLNLHTKKKRQIRDEIFSEVKSILSMYSDSNYDLDFIRKNILYENNTFPRIRHKNFKSEEVVKNFYYIEKLYRIFDNNYISRILCRNTFLENYSLTAKVPVLEFYQRVSASKQQKVNNVIANDQDIKIIAKIRKEFLQYLHDNINKPKIDIPIEFIEKLYSEVPPIMKDKISYGMYYQTDGNITVLNHSAPGIGRHIMRYINDLYEQDQETFMKKYDEHIMKIERDNLVFTDIGSSLGLGINKHAKALHAAFAYPKSVYENEISFNNLSIVFDSKSEAVKVADEKGKIYESTPLGFLFPRVSPGFYGFLSTLSNTQGGGTSFWDRYYTWYENDYQDASIIHFPRITVGNKFIISRETWKIKPDSVKFDPLKSDTDNYIDFCSYLFAQNKIPTIFFGKMARDLDGILEFGKSMDEWEKVISNNKLRKPQYYNLNNYLDYHNLRSLMKNYNDTILTIQEYLPNSLNPTEYLLELNEIKGSEKE